MKRRCELNDDEISRSAKIYFGDKNFYCVNPTTFISVPHVGIVLNRSLTHSTFRKKSFVVVFVLFKFVIRGIELKTLKIISENVGLFCLDFQS